MSCIHTPYIHIIYYIHHIYLFGFLGIWDIGGNTYTTNKNNKTKQKPTPQKFFPKFSLNENDYHLQSN